MESLYESWAKRNPSWERRYQSTVVDVFCDYGKGVSSFLEARGKIFGAGYEIFIIAFFIGLYHNRTKPNREFAGLRLFICSFNSSIFDILFSNSSSN